MSTKHDVVRRVAIPYGATSLVDVSDVLTYIVPSMLEELLAHIEERVGCESADPDLETLYLRVYRDSFRSLHVTAGMETR